MAVVTQQQRPGGVIPLRFHGDFPAVLHCRTYGGCLSGQTHPGKCLDFVRGFQLQPEAAVIRLRRNATRRLACDEALFVRVVKAAFGQRRKMLRQSLKAMPGLLDKCRDLGIEPTARAEELPPEAFLRLAEN